MMQVLNFLFSKRLYPVWIAGQIWFNMANGGVIAIQDENHNWGSNGSHEISYCVIPAELADPNTLGPRLPDPLTTSDPKPIFPLQTGDVAAAELEPDLINHHIPYQLYLLEQPPPPPHRSV